MGTGRDGGRGLSRAGGRGVRALLIDTSPLRASPDFRRLWASQLLSMLGRQASAVAIPFQVYLLTRSSLAVGLLGIAQAVPVLAVGLYGGALADRFDRRTIMLAARGGAIVVSALLAAMAFGLRAPLLAIYLLAGAGAGLYNFEHAARSATVPRLVPAAMLPAAISLSQLLFQSAAVAGPALSGLVIARVGLGWSYSLDVSCAVASLAVLLRLSPQAVVPGSEGLGWRAPLQALRTVRDNRALLGIFAADLNATIFALPRALYPAFATEVFKVGPTGLGLLYAAPAAGALVGTLLSGWVTAVRRQGMTVLIAVAVWGGAITAFGLVGVFTLSLPLLALAGAADMISAVFRQTILQLSVDDSLRGRMSAFNSMVVTLGPNLGDLRAGAMGSVTTPAFAVVAGGLACLAGTALVAALVPELRRYRYVAIRAEAR